MTDYLNYLNKLGYIYNHQHFLVDEPHTLFFLFLFLGVIVTFGVVVSLLPLMDKILGIVAVMMLCGLYVFVPFE